MESKEINLYELFEISKNIKILENILIKLKDEYEFIQSSTDSFFESWDKIRPSITNGADSLCKENLMSFFDEIDKYINKIRARQFFLEEKIQTVNKNEKIDCENLFNTFREYYQDITNQLQEIDETIVNSNNAEEIKKLIKEKDELCRIKKELEFLAGFEEV